MPAEILIGFGKFGVRGHLKNMECSKLWSDSSWFLTIFVDLMACHAEQYILVSVVESSLGKQMSVGASVLVLFATLRWDLENATESQRPAAHGGQRIGVRGNKDWEWERREIICFLFERRVFWLGGKPVTQAQVCFGLWDQFGCLTRSVGAADQSAVWSLLTSLPVLSRKPARTSLVLLFSLKLCLFFLWNKMRG